jgi:Spy/CpxP family protein refolding chaperone
MKKLLFISVIFASSLGMMAQTVQTAAAPVKAQVKAKPETRAKERVAEINNLCSLRADQVGKVNTVFVDFFTKQDILKAKQSTLSTSDYSTQQTALKTERDAAIKGILTSEQMAMLQKAKKEMDAVNVAGKPAGN